MRSTVDVLATVDSSTQGVLAEADVEPARVSVSWKRENATQPLATASNSLQIRLSPTTVAMSDALEQERSLKRL